MKYTVKTITINQLVEAIKRNRIDLQPSYQRNGDIWSPKDQRSLITTIENGWPLPNFFIYKYDENHYEMVDGQQRARTINKFVKKEFKDDGKRLFSEIDNSTFLSYELCVIELTDLQEGESLEHFYTLVNKRGVHLNTAEVTKAEYHDTPFMNLVNDIMNDQRLINLDLFSDSVSKRMNDRTLIEDLAAVLFAGITDKRLEVDRLFNENFSEEDTVKIKDRFSTILDKLSSLNSIRAINSTRYKQRNDFYTLFCFIDEHIGESLDTLNEQYKVLLFFNDEGDIRPTNDSCETFKMYALNCVTQSNSKSARQERLRILDATLCNTNDSKNKELTSIDHYYMQKFHMREIPYKHVGEYYILDVAHIKGE